MKRRDRAVRYLSFLFLVASLLLPFGPAHSLAQEDLQTGGLTILLLDDAGAPVGGGSFEIMTTNGAWSATDELLTGEVVLSGIAPGPVTVTHTAGPDGYTTGSSASAEITPGGMDTVTLATSVIVQQDPEPLPETPPPPPDDDADGVINDADNCVFTGNSDQADVDGDGIGDTCDEDIDGDGLTNADETTLGTDPWSVDTDGDGVGDAEDADPLNAPALLPDDVNDDSNPPDEQEKPASQQQENGQGLSEEQAQSVSVQQALPVIVTATCPDNLALKAPGDDIRFRVTIESQDMYGDLYGLTFSDSRGGQFDPDEIDHLPTLTYRTSWLNTTITETDAAIGSINTRITVTDYKNRIATSEEIECAYSAPVQLTPIGLSSEQVFLDASCDDDGAYHAPRVVVPISTDTVAYEADPDKDIYAPGDTVTVRASWDPSTHTVSDYGAWSPGDADGSAYQTTTFDNVEECNQVGLQIQLTSSPSYSFAGDRIHFNATIINVGEEAITGITLTDDLTGESHSLGALDPGNTHHSAATWDIQVSAEDIGEDLSITNTITATGTSADSNTPVSTAWSATVPYVAPDPVALDIDIGALVQQASCDNDTLIPPTLTLPDATDGYQLTASTAGPFSPGQAVTIAAMTEPGYVFGSIPHGWEPGEDNRSARIEVLFEITPCAEPEIEITKSADVAMVQDEGDIIPYTIRVENTGDIALRNVVIDDPMLADAGIDVSSPDQAGPLSPGQDIVVEIDYPVTATDLAGSNIVNTATVSAEIGHSGERITSDEATVSVDVAHSELTFTKSADIETFHEPGDLITYTLTVTNTGNIALANFSLTDEMEGLSPLTCTLDDNAIDTIPETLDVDEVLECEATYTVDAGDITTGSVVNNATVSADGIEPETRSATVAFEELPAITLTKTVNDENHDGYAAGESISYQLVVHNEGNVPLSNVTVTDTLVADLACEGAGTDTPNIIPSLAIDDEATCTASYLVTQADIDAGEPIVNTASISGTTPGGATIEGADSSATVDVEAAEPDISLVTSATPERVDAAGQEIAYTFTITNDGNVTLANLHISNQVLADTGIDITCPDQSLAPGTSLDCVATYTVSQDEIDAGEPIENTATASGTAPDEQVVTSKTATALINIEHRPGISVDKVVSLVMTETHARDVGEDETVTGLVPGDIVHYLVTATNDGNVTLADITISDAMLADLTCAPDGASLAPGDAITCTGSYRLVEDDAGRLEGITNDAIATATAPDSSTVDGSDNVTVWPAGPDPEIELTKTANPTTYDAARQEIEFTLTVENTGKVPVTNISITDTGLDGLSALDCGTEDNQSGLQPHDTLICTATYAVTQDDLDAGSVTNTASAEAFGPNDIRATDEAEVTITADQQPRLDLSKTVTAVNGGTPADPVDNLAVGDTVTYAITANNTGNVTLDIDITDSMFDENGLTCLQPTSIAPANALECTVEYTVTQTDVDRGSVTNDASVAATAPDGTTLEDTASVTMWTVEAAPGMSMEKSVSPGTIHRADEQVTWTFTVTNSGNVTITDVGIDDPMLAGLDIAVTCPATGLVPGADLTCTAVYTVTQVDMDAGIDIVNEASASGLAPERTGVVSFMAVQVEPRLVTSASSSATLSVVQAPGLSLATLVSTPGDAPITAGTVVTYTFEVTNTGNTSLSGIVVDDPMLASAGITISPVGNLAPGESRTVTATYMVTDADMAAGSVRNVATVSANDGTVTSAPVEATLSLSTPIVEPEPTAVPDQPGPTATPSSPGNADDGIDVTATPEGSGTNEQVSDSAANPEGAEPANDTVITSLPNTGGGSGGSTAFTWLGALIATFLLATAALGLRRRQHA